MMCLTIINLGHVLNVEKNITVPLTPYREFFLSRRWLKNIRPNKSDQSRRVSLVCAQSMFVELKSVSLENNLTTSWESQLETRFEVLYNLECLAHGKDICPDCLLEKKCGDMSQTDECDFMKKTQVHKLVQQQTKKIQGKVNEIDLVKSNGFIDRLWTRIFVLKFVWILINWSNSNQLKTLT